MPGKITELTNMNGTAVIDRAVDLLEIVDITGPTSYKATPNFILGITGNPVGTTDTQTLTGKTLTAPTINSPVLGGTITGTYTLAGTPTFPASVVTLTGVQTLTSKTLTSPVINTPTITNASITQDAVTGFTTANTGTVYGVAITAGKMSGASITNATIPATAIGTDSSYVWTSWVPTITNLTGGTLNYAKYQQIGKKISLRFKYTLAGAGISGVPGVTIPVALNADYAVSDTVLNTTLLYGAGNGRYQGDILVGTSTRLDIYHSNPYASISSVSPFTWASGHQIMFSAEYECV